MIAGLPAGLTAYGGTQLADRYRAVVVGAGRNLGDWGAVSVDVTHARSQLADDSTHQGQSLRFLYAKSLNNYGTNFQLLGYRYSTRGFYTTDDVAYRSMEGYDYEYDSDGRRHKVPVAQSYHNLRYSKKAAFRSIFRKIWGITGHCIFPAVNKITGIRRIPIPGINWDTPVDGKA